MQNIVYTAIANNYDTVKPFPVTNATHIHINEPLFYPNKDPARRAKYCKIMAHKVLPRDTRYSMWVDGSIQLKQLDFKELTDRYLKDGDIAVLKHPTRDCIFKEADVIIALNKDDPELVLKQITRYSQFQHNWGLSENGILLRRHNTAVEWFNELWWEEILIGSKRDQLSFPYVIHKKIPMPFTYIEDRSFFTVLPHLMPQPVTPLPTTKRIGRFKR